MNSFRLASGEPPPSGREALALRAGPLVQRGLSAVRLTGGLLITVSPPLGKTRHFFLLVQKEVAKEKHVQGGHAIVSPLKIPPPGGNRHHGGASRRFYCPVTHRTRHYDAQERAEG